MPPPNIMTDLLRQKAGKSSEVLVQAAQMGTAVIPRNDNRVTLVLIAHATIAYRLSLRQGAATGEGINVAAAGLPIGLDIISYGDMVRGPWFFSTGTNGMNLQYIETTLETP